MACFSKGSGGGKAHLFARDVMGVLYSEYMGAE
jgi:hypothetical protein